MRDNDNKKKQLSRRHAYKLKNNIGIQQSSSEGDDHSHDSAMFYETNENKDSEKQFKKYWRTRGKEVRVWNLILVSSNVLFQIQALLNPMTEEQFQINQIYMVVSIIICVTCIASEYCEKYQNNLIFYTHFIHTIRNGIRMMDFERTRPVYVEQGQIEEWYQLMQAQLLVSYINVAFLFNNFEISKKRLIANILLWITSFFFWVVGSFTLQGLTSLSFKNSLQWFFVFSVGSFQIYTNTNMNKIMFDKMGTIIQYNAKFKHILDHLQESLIILNGHKIEIVNHKFLQQFKQLIPEALPKQREQKQKFCFRLKKCKEEQKEAENEFIEKKIFKFFRDNQENQNIKQGEGFSIFEIASVENVENMIFQIDQFLYVQVKISSLNNGGQYLKIIQVVDVSATILYDEEKKQNQLLGMINATVSHELRNPLNSISAQNILKGNLYKQLENSLKKLGKNSQEFDHILQDLNEGLEIQEASTNIMAFMIKDLLDFSQIKSGQFQKNLKKFNIKDTISTVMRMLKHIAEENCIEFFATYNSISDFEGSLQHGPMVYTDQNRVMQVLLGLLSNALKFTEKGKVQIDVHIRDNFLEISVIDTGVGIPYEDQDKLFKLFGYVQDVKQMNTHGIGLGLTISKQIVQAFGGDITFKSVPEKGSVFTFTFKMDDSNGQMIDNHFSHFVLDSMNLKFCWKPNRRAQEIQYVQGIDKKEYCDADNYSDIQIELCQNDKNQILDASHGSLKKRLESEESLDLSQRLKKILIVDDQIFNIQALKIILKYSINIKFSEDIIVYGNNGFHALQLVEADLENNRNQFSSYDLILMDCNMPVMDGYTSASKIRDLIHKAGLEQPLIIAVTGHTEREYVERAIICGMNMVLSKPVSVNILRYIIRELGYQQQEQVQLRIDQNQLNVVDRYVQQMQTTEKRKIKNVKEDSMIVKRRVSSYMGIDFKF